MNEEKSMTEEIKDAITDEEHPLEEKARSAPFAILALTYIVILGVASLAVAAIVWAI